VNLAAVLEGAAARAGDREAVVDGALRLTYAQLRERAARLAAGLAELGLERGSSRATAAARS
jgi:non-ribosomal peptide synthetase component E (peptide arylation enzyme)